LPHRAATSTKHPRAIECGQLKGKLKQQAMARILVIEDEAPIRGNLARFVKLEGHDAIEAADGRAGLETAISEQPDLIFCDVMMPEMSGHELVKALRANIHTAHIPIVLLTAKADRSDVRQGMNLGADDYLTKPFQRDELLACVQAQLDKASAQQMA